MSKNKCPFHNINKEVEKLPFESESNCGLRVYRLHPGGARVIKADHKLNGDMYKSQQTSDALKWCGPMIHANKLGFWLRPPVDMDVTYKGNGEWDYVFYHPYHPTERFVLEGNLREEDKFRDVHRQRIAFGASEPNTLQIWTGCIFRTNPGWCMHIRNPINFPDAFARPCHIQEGVIETDWMNYDIWFNIKFHKEEEMVSLRRDMWPPIAQFVPVRRSSYEGEWDDISDKMLSIENADGKEVWESWQDYNYRKWILNGEKDPLTYHKTRKSAVREMRENGLIP